MTNQLFAARVEDTAELSEKSSSVKFLGFLRPEETALADKILKNMHCRYIFFGGYESAERTMLCCLPEWCEQPQFPISSLTISYRENDKLSHRDFLGALMSLGITRECVGDILVASGRTVIFLKSEIAKHIREQITKIGSVGVTVTEGHSLPLPGLGSLKDFSQTAASCRLDCVIAAILGVSRSRALSLINGDFVTLGGLLEGKPTRIVSAGDIITVRSVGKFIISDTDGITKKGRTVIKYQKFI